MSIQNQKDETNVILLLVYCIRANPCTGWLNTNATIRALSSEHAAALSEQYTYVRT